MAYYTFTYNSTKLFGGVPQDSEIELIIEYTKCSFSGMGD